MSGVSEGHRERAGLFLKATRWLHDRGGDAAVLAAFGDPQPVNEVWDSGVEEFKSFLRRRCREALKSGSGRGAA